VQNYIYSKNSKNSEDGKRTTKMIDSNENSILTLDDINKLRLFDIRVGSEIVKSDVFTANFGQKGLDSSEYSHLYQNSISGIEIIDNHVFIATAFGPLIIDMRLDFTPYNFDSLVQSATQNNHQSSLGAVTKGGFLDFNADLVFSSQIGDHYIDLTSRGTCDLVGCLAVSRAIKDVCVNKSTGEVFVLCGGIADGAISQQLEQEAQYSLAFNQKQSIDACNDEVCIFRKGLSGAYGMSDFWELKGEANRIIFNEVSGKA
jgi:hypothetical protein